MKLTAEQRKERRTIIEQRRLEKQDLDRRKFGGKMTDFKDNDEKKLEQHHLKAYLRGKSHFQHGFNYEKGLKYPNFIEVKSEYSYTKSQ